MSSHCFDLASIPPLVPPVIVPDFVSRIPSTVTTNQITYGNVYYVTFGQVSTHQECNTCILTCKYMVDILNLTAKKESITRSQREKYTANQKGKVPNLSNNDMVQHNMIQN